MSVREEEEERKRSGDAGDEIEKLKRPQTLSDFQRLEVGLFQVASLLSHPSRASGPTLDKK